MSTTCRQQHLLLVLLLVSYGRQDQQTSTTIKWRWLSRERWPPATTTRSSLLLKTSRIKNDRKKKKYSKKNRSTSNRWTLKICGRCVFCVWWKRMVIRKSMYLCVTQLLRLLAKHSVTNYVKYTRLYEEIVLCKDFNNQFFILFF
jgi:hypothetical protein